jgi:site-specific DNA-cytosine methylase
MQTTLLKFYFQSHAVNKILNKTSNTYDFVDFFCGIGGASQGALEAGLNVCISIDNNKKLLAIHKSNHLKSAHLCQSLPSLNNIPLPNTGKWHLHGSPPCQELSQANVRATSESRENGLKLVKWFLNFAIHSKATTWSMEQVPVKQVVNELELTKLLYPGKVDYCIVNCATLGVPQTRKRLFAGTPFLIQKLKRRRCLKKTVGDVIANPRGTHTRAETRKTQNNFYTYDELCRSINKQCQTVTAGNGLRWANPGSGEIPFKMNRHEVKILQSFPASYKLKCSNALGILGVGNAVPPLAMKELLRPITLGFYSSKVNADPMSPTYNSMVHSTIT